MTEPFDDVDDWDGMDKRGRWVRPPGMSIVRALFWNPFDPYIIRMQSSFVSVSINFYWLFHLRRYREAHRTLG
jgi:hypothetical protein